MAILEAINDERSRVAVDGPLGLDLGGGQHGGPCGLDGPIGVVLQLFSDWFLAHQQKSFAVRCQGRQKIYKIRHVYFSCWDFAPAPQTRGLFYE